MEIRILSKDKFDYRREVKNGYTKLGIILKMEIVIIRFFFRIFRNLRRALQKYMPFGEKIIVLKFELPWISIMPGKITLNFYLRGLLYKGGPKN